jgi:hypothetical protein
MQAFGRSQAIDHLAFPIGHLVKIKSVFFDTQSPMFNVK